MGRQIYIPPRVGMDIPAEISLLPKLDFGALLAAKKPNYNNKSTAGFASNWRGELLTASTNRTLNIAAATNICRMPWGVEGYTATMANSSFTSLIKHTTRAYSDITYIKRETEGRKDFLKNAAIAANMFDATPKVLRSTAVSASLISELPENNARASAFYPLDGSTATEEIYSVESESIAKIRRWEDAGALIGFPMFGLNKVMLNFVYRIIVSGDNVPYGVTMPLRLCFSPIAGEQRLHEWPETLTLEGEDHGIYIPSGILAPKTLDLSCSVPTNGNGALQEASIVLEVPPSGLMHIWPEIDPWKYQDYATSIMAYEHDEGTFTTRIKAVVSLSWARAIAP